MNLEDKIGQLMLVGFEGYMAPDYILEWLANGQISGVILFERNIESPEQVAAMTRQIHEAAKYPALVAIDQEGGYVARLRKKFTESPGAMALAAGNDSAMTKQMSQILGAEMRELGINWDYAPVVDILHNIHNPTLGVRSFSSDAAWVSKMGVAAIEGFQAGGTAACAKHFPGLGNTATDTHLALPALDTAADSLREVDLEPYRAAIEAGVASIMLTHTIYTDVDPDLPATLSAVIAQDWLRGELGFTGVTTTDCMEMQAITDNYGSGESAVLAALAGIDLILVSHTRDRQQASYDALLEAAQSGRISDEHIDAAVTRITALKEQFAIQPEGISAENIFSEARQAVALQAARAGVVSLKTDEALLPLQGLTDKTVALVEFASYRDSNVIEQKEATGLAQYLLNEVPNLKAAAIRGAVPDDELQRATELAQAADVLVLATRNANFIERQLEAAKQLAQLADSVILLCLRNPFEAADLSPYANVILCSCGDGTPSIQAVAEALLGSFESNGTLTVELAIN